MSSILIRSVEWQGRPTDLFIEGNTIARIAETIDAPLLAEYDAARAATGGLGAVALHGRRVEGAVQVSPAEHARIAAAPPDAVIHAEENDVILVRMGE